MTPPSPPPPATRTRPLVCTADEVRELLTAGAAEIRRKVKAPTIQARDGRKSVGRMLVDMERAWVDPGFPLGDDDAALPMERWGKGADPAPESAYRYQYLHVPIAHPSDGWSADPRDDRWTRLYCPIGRPGDLLIIKEAAYIAPPNFGEPGDGNTTDREGRRRVVGYAASMCGESVRCAKDYGVKLTPSIHMPAWAARLTPTLLSVRVERTGERWDWLAAVRRLEGRA